MLQNVSHTILQQLNTIQVQSGKTVKNLPIENSLVAVKITGKEGNFFKLLINGTTFRAQLPLNLNVGDTFIAKVTSQVPLTLAGNNILHPGSSSNYLPAMLSLLGIQETKTALDFARILVDSRKPFVKSKFDRIMKYFHDMNIEPDEFQIYLFMQVYIQNDEFIDYFLKQHAKKIQLSLRELMDSIFETVLAFIYTDIDGEVLDDLREYLILDYRDDRIIPGEKQLQDRDRQLLNFVKKINIYADSTDFDVGIKDKCALLANFLIQFLMQKSVYNRFGVYPDFLIIIKNTSQNLILLNSYKTTDSINEQVYSLGTKFEQIGVGEIAVKGMFFRDRVFADIFIEKIPDEKIAKKVSEVNKLLNEVLRLTSFVQVKQSPSVIRS